MNFYLFLKIKNKYITNNLCNDCEHNYVDDDIDITPDYSKRITYCTICEHTL